MAVKQTWFACVRNRLKRIHLLRLPILFFWRVLAGFRVYRSILLTSEEETVILGTAWLGTGDYYLCGCLLPAWLEQKQIQHFVFLTPDKAEKKVLQLFPVLQGHVRTLPDGTTYYHLLLFRAFLGPSHCRFFYLHHQQPFPTNNGLNISNGALQGFRGLNMLDFYLASGFCLPEITALVPPEFEKNKVRLRKWFDEYHLRPGKTVLLAPYSTGLEEYLPPISLWEEIARLLKGRGYCVCTNCFGKEQPVPGTVAVSVPFAQTVPFLNTAGGFVGIRSGLCDIISTSICKKIVLHTRSAKWWPTNCSIAYTGLGNICLCKDAVELYYSQGTSRDCVEAIARLLIV